ncbi:MAG: hypothetical protein WCQ99_00945 [Pseudomonadota bacterium]
MKKAFKIIGAATGIIIVAAALFIAAYTPARYSDFRVYENLRSFTVTLLQDYKAAERPISQDFKNFSLDLSFPYSKLFGGSSLGIPLVSYESDRITAASISQFEVPFKSSYYRDFTFNLRPRFDCRAPVFHIDFMKPSPGLPGLCSMDFFNVDPQNINLETFFGKEMDTIKKAMAGVEKYQRTVAEGRGKITAYLNPFKSPYRMELQEPKTKDEKVRQAYYEAVAEAYKLALTAYMKSLYSLPSDHSYATTHEEKTRAFVQALYDKDFAVNMGKRIFKDSFKKYWLDGFWTVQIDMKEK